MLIDRLYETVEKKGFVCVGLDSSIDYVPEKIKRKYLNIEDIIFNYNKEIIDATSDISAIYKLQIAYYEALGIEGLKAYKRTLEYIKSTGNLSIADIKRGDISNTAEQYAKAHFSGDFETDFITVNPYMGFDSITPYFPYLESKNKGIFVLIRTSNPGAKDIEYLNVGDEYLYCKIGDKLCEMSEKFRGDCGYSSLGFVIGGTYSEEAVEIRKRYNNMFFLIPGYGAQGAKAEDIREYLNDFNGGVVNSSRGIIKNYMKYEDGEEKFSKYTRDAVMKMRRDIYGGESL